MAKRSNGEGTIYPIKVNGKITGYRASWVLCCVGRKVDRISGVRSKKSDAVALLDSWKAKGRETLLLEREKKSRKKEVVAKSTQEVDGTFNERLLHDYLIFRYLRMVERELSENTSTSYRNAIETHIIPRFPNVALGDVTPTQIEEFLNALVEDEVGSRAAQIAFQVLKRAIRYAITPLRLIDNNPCDGFRNPQYEADDIKPFEADEVRRILGQVKGTRHYAMLAMCFMTGMRQGEINGLAWENVDLAEKVVRVREQCLEVSGRRRIAKVKTKTSVRDIALCDLVIDALKDHRAILLKEGHASHERVFPAPEGGLESRNNIRTRIWLPLLKRLGLEPRGLHHARHTFATLSLNNGTPLASVSKDLGHKKQSTTLEIYSKHLKSQQRMSADTMQRLIG